MTSLSITNVPVMSLLTNGYMLSQAKPPMHLHERITSHRVRSWVGFMLIVWVIVCVFVIDMP